MTALVGAPAVFDSAPTRHERLLAWVREVADLTTPEQIVLCAGSREEWDRLSAELVEAGHARAARPAAQAQLVLGTHRPDRRGPRRGAHLHLLGATRPMPARRTTGWLRPR